MKKRRSAHLLVLPVALALALLLAACAASAQPAATPEEEEFRASSVAGPTATPVLTVEEFVPPRVMGSIAARLSALLGQEVRADEVRVVSVERREWQDTSFGCPEPGQMYQPVVTPGYRIVVLVGGEEYEFRTDADGRVVRLCRPGPAAGRDDMSSEEGEEESMGTPVLPDEARRAFEKALALVEQKSQMSREAITLTAWESVTWSDSSLGCPEPGKVYLQVITPGYRFVFQAGDAQYEVHTDERGRAAVICAPRKGELGGE